MKLHCSEWHAASDMSDEQVLADQQELPEFERGLFEVYDRDPDEVPVVRWHLTAHAADAVVHTSTCIAGSQLCMHYL